MGNKLHTGISPISRKQNHNAVAACAYRSGRNLYEEKNNVIYNYSRRSSVLEAEIFAPENAPQWMKDNDWERLGNEVERVESLHSHRATALLAKDFQFSLPRELSHEENWNLAKNFSKKFNDRGLMVATAFHESPASDGGVNPHCHFFVPMRTVNENGFHTHKYRDFDKKGTNEFDKLRREFYQCVNEALESAGIDARYSPDKESGKKKTRHLGKDAAAVESKGQRTRAGDYNSKVPYHNMVEGYEVVDDAGAREVGKWKAYQEHERLHWISQRQHERGAAIASAEAAQKSQSSVTTPPATRTEKATDHAREGAKLAARQSMTHLQRMQQSPDSGWNKGR